MADKKYQVFISSTYRDLIEHRRDIAKSVLDLGQIPAAMEYFPASDEEQFRYIKRVIDQCDYYVLVLAGKYGSTDVDGTSFTEKEYDYAVEKGKFVLGFPVRDIGKLPRDQTEEGEKAQKLASFRGKVMTGRLVREWDDRQHLDNQVTKALAIAFTEFPQDGWVRSPRNSNEELLTELNDLRKENERLKGNAKANAPTAHLDLNLVDMESRFSFTTIDSGALRRAEHQHTLSWSEIFLCVAAALRGSMKRGALSREVAIFLDGDIEDVMRQYVEARSWELILTQLTAYGLLYTEDREIYSLTDEGVIAYTRRAVLSKSG